MNVFSFAECRGQIDIAEGYADDNEIVTAGSIADLPHLRFRRHGAAGNEVSGCRFVLHAGAAGHVTLFCAHSDIGVEIGAQTRLNIDIRLWRDCTVRIGDHTTINQARLVADKSDIVIGEDCMFSDDILVQSADQHGLLDLATLAFSNAHRRRVEIGDHVWIGRRSVLMPDVAIGDGSVVGTGSIVTKSFGPCRYLVGVPAREVREGASWTRLPEKINAREEAFFARTKDHSPTAPSGDDILS